MVADIFLEGLFKTNFEEFQLTHNCKLVSKGYTARESSEKNNIKNVHIFCGFFNKNQRHPDLHCPNHVLAIFPKCDTNSAPLKQTPTTSNCTVSTKIPPKIKLKNAEISSTQRVLLTILTTILNQNSDLQNSTIVCSNTEPKCRHKNTKTHDWMSAKDIRKYVFLTKPFHVDSDVIYVLRFY